MQTDIAVNLTAVSGLLVGVSALVIAASVFVLMLRLGSAVNKLSDK